ncbi:hypothetical protein D3C75_537380 [compost metagenome]
MSCERLIVLIVADFIDLTELVSKQEHGHDEIRLLQYLMAVDHQRMKMQQQRVFICWCMLKIPFPLTQEGIILSIDAQLLIKRDEHPVGGFLPQFRLPVSQTDSQAESLVIRRILLLEQNDCLISITELILDQQICIGIIVNNRRILIRSRDSVNTKGSAACRIKVPQVCPEARGFEQDFCPLADQELQIPCCLYILLNSVGNIGIYMRLGRTRREISRVLASVNGAPWIQRSFLRQQPGLLPGLIQRGIAEFQQLPGNLRLGVGEERQHVHFRIPEIMPLVPLAG